jgi:HPt (histidine-containing phosphotransfer) domain-containing protein
MLPAFFRLFLRGWKMDQTGQGGDPDETFPLQNDEAAFDGVLDADVFERLRRSLDELAPGSLDRVLDEYLRDAPAQIEGMKLALSAGDMPELRRAAHSLKGSSLWLGGVRLGEWCRQLELLHEDLMEKFAPSLIVAIERELGQVMRALARRRMGQKKPSPGSVDTAGEGS